jgi:outer membrane murein-binding lipoprotein Lpp
MNVRPSLAVTLCVLALSGLLAAGCDSKPSYCSKVDQLELSVKDVGEIDLSKGVSSLTSAVAKVQSSANDAVAAARKDFPTETGRIESSVSTLATAIDQLPSSPSATQIATLALEIKSVVDAVDSFVSQTKKKCG